MKKTMILSTLVAGILLGTICSGCGESDESKANIKRQTELMEKQAEADRRKEARRRQAIKDAREIHRIQRENIRKHSTPAPETLFFNENPAGKDKE